MGGSREKDYVQPSIPGYNAWPYDSGKIPNTTAILDTGANSTYVKHRLLLVLDNTYPTLTPANIRKLYPHNDPIIAKAQLSKKLILKHPIREHTLTYCGELVELDVLMVHSPSSYIPRAHGGFRHVVFLVDVFSS